MRLELQAGVDRGSPSGLSCKERQADVGKVRPVRACRKGGDIQISSVKRLLRPQCGE